jgi:hypothetical protein
MTHQVQVPARAFGGEFKEAAAHVSTAERDGHGISFGQHPIAAVAVPTAALR